MRHRLSLLSLLLLAISPFAHSQAYNAFQSKTLTATGTGQRIVENSTIGYHQLSWTVSGTVSTCQIQIDSSPDNSSWTAGGIITAQTCTSNGTSVVTAGSANYIRVNLTTLSGAGATIKYVYKGWINNPSGSGASFYQTAQSNGTPLTQRPVINYSTGFTCSDDAGNSRTNCTVTVSGSSVPSPSANGIVKCTGTNCSTSVVVTAPSGAIVGTTDPQSLTNKDLTGAGNTFPTLNQNTTGTASGISTSGAANQIVATPNGSSGAPTIRAMVAADVPTLNQNTTGSAAKWTTARNLAGNSVDGSANVPFANKFLVQGTSDTGLSSAQFMGALGTGLVKNTTTTGVQSIANAADIDTLFTGTGKCYLFKGTSPGSNDGCDVPPGSSAGNQYSVQYSSNGTGGFASTTPPSTNGDYVVRYHVTASAAVAPTAVQVGVNSRSITGSTTTDTFLFSDANALVYHDQAATGTVTETLPTATSLGNASYAVKYCNNSPQTDTITPTTWTIQADASVAGTTLSVPPGVCYFISVDANSGTQWHASGTNTSVASGANTSLSNLSAVALNTSLLTGSGTIDLGSTTKPFRNIYFVGSGTYGANSFEFIGTPTSTRQVTVPDASFTIAKSTDATTVNSQSCALNGSCTVTVPVATGVTGLGTGIATWLTTPSSANLRSAITDKTGTGLSYFQGGDLGTPSAGVGTNLTGIPGTGLTNNSVTSTQLAAQYSKGACTEVWGGTGTSNVLTSGDDAISNNTCYNDSGVTRTITAVKCRSDNASNTTTINPTFGSDGTGTTILSGALTCGNSYAYSTSGTVSNASWTTGTGIRPVMGGTLTGTSIAMIVEYTY